MTVVPLRPVEPTSTVAPEVRSKIALLPQTDYGNAQRLAGLHGSDIRYVPESGRWLIWTGSIWAPDQDGAITRRAKDTVRTILDCESCLPDGDARERLRKHARRSESKPRLDSMIALAASETGIVTSVSALDADPMLFAAANVTIDLRTGVPRPHRREDLITQISSVQFDRAAECPRWRQFISEISGNDEGLAGYLQRAVGYSMTGRTDEQVAFIAHGTGRNGKSVFFEVLRSLMGDYARAADFSTFLTQRTEAVRNDLARLRGSRCVTASEMPEGSRLDEVVLKQLTGGDTIAARFLYREFFEFRPELKVWLITNHRPIVAGTDFGIWRRIRLIPFEVRIPSESVDRGLAEKLRSELPGILNWAITGCLAWQAHHLVAPEAVRRATLAYYEECDWLSEFLEACCVVQVDAKVAAGVIYGAYRSWAKEAGLVPLARNAFGMMLRDRGFKPVRTSGERSWLGVALRTVDLYE